MDQEDRPYVWQMIRDAVDELGSPTTNVAVRDWILSKYPGTNRNTIQCQIIVCTVNHSSRIHYPENKKPREATGPYDFLFRPDRGRLVSYDPSRHGRWVIRQTDDGRLEVGQADDENTDVLAEVQPAGQSTTEGHAFAAEHHLRDYLAQHLESIEPGLQLFVDDQGNDGMEYVTPIGRIDLLAIDNDDRLVAIELKVGRGPDSVAGQILRYVNWIRCNMPNGATVRGIIIAQHISDKIRYAIASEPAVSAIEYEIELSLKPVAPVNPG